MPGIPETSVGRNIFNDSLAVMKKHIILTQLFETGGSNSHLKVLLKYFKKEQVILAIENGNELNYLKEIDPGSAIGNKVLTGLHQYACLTYKLSTNIRELLNIIVSLVRFLLLSIKNGFADITISAVAPEKHLYVLWLPFVRVTYILHTLPQGRLTPFTSFTCNYRLGKKKKIVVVSNAMNKLLCNKWSIADKKQPYVVTIYNTLLNENSTTDHPVRELSKKTVLTIGSIDFNKNPETWLKVAQAVTARRHDTDFIWIGNGAELEHFRESVKDNDAIHFEGLAKDPKPFLQKAALYYQPSLNESHGIAVLEAMNAGLPCVVSNIGGLNESVSHHYNGVLVTPLNAAESADAITKLLDDPEKLKTYGHNSFDRYHHLFSYDVFKAAMDNIYLN
ncbi:MAG TPA: glycosyltransferase family 4 protein [Mucilaginibacter sp.]